MHFATLLIYLQIHLYDFIEYYFIFMMTEAIEKMMQRLDEKLDEFRKELKEGQDKVAHYHYSLFFNSKYPKVCRPKST